MTTASKNKLQISLIKLKEGKQRFSQNFCAEDLDLSTLEFSSPIEIDATLIKNGDMVVISGKVNFRLELCCANCLEKYEKDFSEDLYQEYVKTNKLMSTPHLLTRRVMSNHKASEKTSHNLTIGAGSIETARLEGIDFIREFYTADFFDLTPLIHDTILLAVPIAAWCREDCPGVSV